MKIVITESDMQFGEYQENLIFQIEDSAQYKEKLRQILPKKRKLSIRSTYKRLLKRCAILLIYMQTLC